MPYYHTPDGRTYYFRDSNSPHIPAGSVEITQEEARIINAERMAAQKEARHTPKTRARKKKYAGIDFKGVMCSATKEDAWGLAAVKEDILAGNHTVFEFRGSGGKLLLTAEIWDEFMAVWRPFRATFFTTEIGAVPAAEIPPPPEPPPPPPPPDDKPEEPEPEAPAAETPPEPDAEPEEDAADETTPPPAS